MKTKLSTAILTILVAFTTASRAANESPDTKAAANTTETVATAQSRVIEQALPLATLLRAIKENDAALFLECWDKPRAERMGLNHESVGIWITRYKEKFTKHLGDYALSDFAYEFDGDAEAGMLKVRFKGKDLTPLKVIKSGNVWKLGEK